MTAARAVARRALGESRVRNLSFAVFFALIAYVNVVGYRHTYSTFAERLQFATSFGANKALRLFYGAPHDLLSVGGYAAWRVGGTMAIAAGVWGVLAAVKSMRAEEESGRLELVLAGTVTRGAAFGAALAACAVGAALLWLALFAGLAAGNLSAGSSAFLALATITPALVFVGVGALASQVAPTRRLALGLGNAVLAVTLAVRIVADTSPGLGWMRWLTPLGWPEEMRAFAGARPAVLLLPLSVTALLIGLAALLAARRDLGAGMIGSRDTAPPNPRLLSSPTALALRGERATLLAWLAGIGFYALIIGLLSTSFSNSTLPANVQRTLRKVGGASLTTPVGALGFYFLLFVLAVSMFACAQVVSARREEADGRLDTLFAHPVSRARWLAGRLLLATAGAAALALAAGVLAWAGASSQGAGVPLSKLLEAGANCLPAALLFLALATLAFAFVPRATPAIAYTLVAATFVVELFGALVNAPTWLLSLSPFHHVGLVPAQPFKAIGALAMLALAAAAALAAIWRFNRRDLTV